MNDKERKKTSALINIKNSLALREHQSDAIFLMFLDADDLISLDFFTYVLNAFDINECDDLCMMAGYLFDYKNRRCGFLNGKDRIFYRNCGSCFISKVKQPDFSENGFLYKLRNHVNFPTISASSGRKVFSFPHAVALYLVNHGQNDASERHGEQHMINFVKQYACDPEKIEMLYEKFPALAVLEL